MKLLAIQQHRKTVQYALSLLTVGLTALICFVFVDFISYQMVALLLLFVLSLLAMVMDIMPVLLAAILSAFIWDFFFIQPLYTLHIGKATDFLMFLMYFVIALLNAVLTFKIRAAERKARDKEEQAKTIILYNTLFNSLSHELKTPIFTIMGAVDTLKEQKQALSPTHTNELIDEIEIASNRLHRQVANLLNMSRLEAGALHLKLDWCDVNELVFSILAEHKTDAEQHNIIFNPVDDLPLFRLDGGLVAQVLHNLLHNALRYTPSDSSIEISIHYEEQQAIFRIADNGNGFPPETLDLAFHKFYRLPQSKAGGTGLGLSIAKGFAEAHGGRIDLQNRATGGAQFTVYIPCVVAEFNFSQEL
jgi:two-component system, OmpR family, sensor histidine kinase KdpD